MYKIQNCWAHVLVAGALASAALLPVPAAEAQTESVVYSFQDDGADGTNPLGSLINVGGTLYGTTTFGGANTSCTFGCGAVFSLNPTTGAETVLHSFNDNGTDGYHLTGSLIDVDGTLYGTAENGGTNGEGIVFKINRRTGAEAVVYAFRNNGTDGENPKAGLMNVGDMLYSTTLAGGTNGEGTVFSLNPKTGAEAVVYSFQNNGTDGANPVSGLINVDGTLYGTTSESGSPCNARGGCGTVFSINLTSGAETVVHSFRNNGADGMYPISGLISVGLDGTLYGTTYEGGTGNCTSNGFTGCGTVFKINPRTSAEIVVYSFQSNGTDGTIPDAGLISVSGALYGTASYGGANCVNQDCGTVFKIIPKTGAETVLHSFGSGTDGLNPEASLINVDGTLYGTSIDGGTGCNGHGLIGCGTVFKITP